MRSVREKTFTKYVSSLIGVTSHITPLPAGEGLGEGPPPHGLETVRKNAQWTLCALWEIKLPCESQAFFLTWRVRSLSHREHRWTEHTAFHRDIKSTDFTERYSHRSLTPSPSPFKNMPFNGQEHALQRPRTRPSWCLIRPFFNAIFNILISCRLQRQTKHTYWTEI